MGTGNWYEDELLYNPILCFVQKNLAKGVSPDTIKKKYITDFLSIFLFLRPISCFFLKLFPNEALSKHVGANVALNCALDIIFLL